MRHIPNLLSVSRIVMIPFFLWQFFLGHTTAAAGILLASGLTDLLDGYLARRNGWISQLGKVLDPIADKLTQIAVCVALAIRMRQYWFVFAVLLLKELVMLVLGGYLLTKGVKLEGAKWFGKVATVLFYVSMTAVVLWTAMPQWLVTGLFALVVISALLSAALYIPEYLRYKRGWANHGGQTAMVDETTGSGAM